MGRLRWLLVSILGVFAWFFTAAIASAGVSALLGDPAEIVGLWLGVLGILHLALFLPAIRFVLDIVGKKISDIGLFVPPNWQTDVMLGAALGLIWPLLQFLILIPLTGGAQREDVIASRNLIGEGPLGLLGVILLSWTIAAIGEELFFRGHIITTVRGLIGDSKAGILAAVFVSVSLFALTHAYQGWIGILDVDVFGFLLALLYLRRGSLLASVIAHGLSNSLLFAGLYFWY